jgi:hypothetical protein
MATSHKFKDLEDLLAYWPDIPWRADYDHNVSIYDEKQETYVPVAAGNYVVSIGSRFEVSDSNPDKAKKAPKAEAPSAPAVEPVPQVAPENIGAPAYSPEGKAHPD